MSLYATYYHVITSPKRRKPQISEDIEDRVYAYLASLIRRYGGSPLAINGMPDHVHMLLWLPSNRQLSDTMRFVKSKSSALIRRHLGVPDFTWEVGFAVFTAYERDLHVVKRYIARQKQHHKQVSTSQEIDRLEEQARSALPQNDPVSDVVIGPPAPDEVP